MEETYVISLHIRQRKLFSKVPCDGGLATSCWAGDDPDMLNVLGWWHVAVHVVGGVARYWM